MKSVTLADRKRNVHTPQWIEEAGIVQVGQKVVRRKEVDVLIVMTTEQIFKRGDCRWQVVPTARRDHLANERRRPQRQSQRMVGANAAAVHEQRSDTVVRDHERNHFMIDVALVVPVPAGARRWRGGAAV